MNNWEWFGKAFFVCLIAIVVSLASGYIMEFIIPGQGEWFSGWFAASAFYMSWDKFGLKDFEKEKYHQK